jgi:hypothetical protein
MKPARIWSSFHDSREQRPNTAGSAQESAAHPPQSKDLKINLLAVRCAGLYEHCFRNRRIPAPSEGV